MFFVTGLPVLFYQFLDTDAKFSQFVHFKCSRKREAAKNHRTVTFMKIATYSNQT